ncbi:hypothetical protein [Streptosporangium album]|uniref:HNH endonuclease n=1 Tax=Streptosporangium album TaxID=47479 RepID=UPI0031EE86E2
MLEGEARAVMAELDVFVEKVLIAEYTRGGRRARNPAYLEVANLLAKARRRGDRVQARMLRRRLHSLPSADPNDPAYRRLRYIRYADDHLLGFTGPKAEAEEIKQRLVAFLREDLKLEPSHDKTPITHARTRAARFLGYEINVQHNSSKATRGRRAVNVQVHHVRKLADPGQHQPVWMRTMAKRRRKSLVVRDACHAHIHTGQFAAPLTQ